jgi:HSP20 family molecular chaperone IbpA
MSNQSSQTEVARRGSNGEVTKEQNGRGAASESAIRPAVDIFETEDGITLQADMPGVSKDRLDVRIDGTNLLVEGRIGILPQDKAQQPLYADVGAAFYRLCFWLSMVFEQNILFANFRAGWFAGRMPTRRAGGPRPFYVRGV